MDFCLVLFQVKFELKLSQKNQTLMIKMWSVRGSAEIGSLLCVTVTVVTVVCTYLLKAGHVGLRAQCTLTQRHQVTMTISVSECA